MPVPTRTLRAVLLALAVIMVAVVLGFLAYAHHRAKSFLAGLPGRFGMTIDKETDNFNFSQAYRNKTIFTLHAARQIQHENGRYTLRDATVTLYGRGETGRPGTRVNPADANRVDTIHGAEFEFDQPKGILSAAGDVYLDLDASSPGTSATPPAAGQHRPADDDLVHIKTSGLIYTQKTRAASTNNFIEFHRAGISGTAVGATYSSEGGIIVLQSQVHVAGLRNGHPLELTATHAEFDQSSNLLKLTGAHYTAPGATGPQTLTADHALVRMTENNEPRRVEAEGHVSLAAPGRGTVQSASLAADLNDRGQPTLAVLTGGVRFAGSPSPATAGRNQHGSASAARLTFDALGRPTHLSLTGGAELTEAAPTADRLLRAADVELAFLPNPRSAKPGTGKTASGKSNLSGAEAFGAGGATLRLVDRAHPETSPSAPGKPPAAAITTTEIHAAKLTGRFTQGPASRLIARQTASATQQLTGLDGVGQTSIEQTTASATGLPLSRTRSTGDTFRLDFDSAPQTIPQPAARPAARRPAPPTPNRLALARAQQHGNVVIDHQAAPRKPGDPPETLHATAADALFIASADTLTLDGNVALDDAASNLFADHLTLDHVDRDRAGSTSEASGNVRVSYTQATSPGAPPAEPVHVLAARASASRATGISQFFAAPGGRVRLWQAGSQVEAPRLILNRAARTLSAFSLGDGADVRTLLSPTPAKPRTVPAGTTPTKTPTPSGPSRILSRQMLYTDAAREIDFRGAVRMDTSSGSTSAQEAQVLLAPSGKVAAPAQPAAGPLGANLFGSGQVERVVATGDVQITQPGRKATGSRLVYTAADQTFVLTGTPTVQPHLADDTRGTVTGTLLRFHTGDDSVEVEGTPGTRVHTETRTK